MRMMVKVTVLCYNSITACESPADAMFHVIHCGRADMRGIVSRETKMRKDARVFHVKHSERKCAMKILTARPHRLLGECVRRLGEKMEHV